jgi:hypothetical protein
MTNVFKEKTVLAHRFQTSPHVRRFLSHGRGRRFDPCIAHHQFQTLTPCLVIGFRRSSGPTVWPTRSNGSRPVGPPGRGFHSSLVRLSCEHYRLGLRRVSVHDSGVDELACPRGDDVAERFYCAGLSSTISFPSFGSELSAASATSPRSPVSAWSVAETAWLSASFGFAVSA